jgi:hypothetical protein
MRRDFTVVLRSLVRLLSCDQPWHAPSGLCARPLIFLTSSAIQESALRVGWYCGILVGCVFCSIEECYSESTIWICIED